MSESNKVNLFIVGAAKSATTSVYHYLSQHPDVFFPKLKEPRFFSSKYYSFPHNGIKDIEFTDKWIVKSLKDYEELYQGSFKKKIVGDASVDYLYIHQTAKDIYEYNPNAKIIIILRNPVKRAFSHYTHLVRDGREKLSFIEGLSLEEERIKDNYEFSWHYLSVGMYYEQVKTYIEHFSKEQVLVVLFEELVSNPQKECYEIIKFLGIDFKSVENLSFSLINKTGAPILQSLSNIINRPSIFKTLLKSLVPHEIGIKIKGFLNNVTLLNVDFPSDHRKLLEKKFLDDILKLEKLICRDLIGLWDINLGKRNEIN